MGACVRRDRVQQKVCWFHDWVKTSYVGLSGDALVVTACVAGQTIAAWATGVAVVAPAWPLRGWSGVAGERPSPWERPDRRNTARQTAQRDLLRIPVAERA